MNSLNELVSELVQTRLDRGLTQEDVARIMDVGQPTVSQFERCDGEPKFSTVQRYAKAVGAYVELDVTRLPWETDNGQ